MSCVRCQLVGNDLDQPVGLLSRHGSLDNNLHARRLTRKRDLCRASLEPEVTPSLNWLAAPAPGLIYPRLIIAMDNQWKAGDIILRSDQILKQAAAGLQVVRMLRR